MIKTNAAWKRIAIDPYHHTTFELTVDGQTIPPTRIALSPEITSALYTDRWSVGNSHLPARPRNRSTQKGGEGANAVHHLAEGRRLGAGG